MSVVPNLTQNAQYYYVDGTGAVYVNQNSPIAGFPYLQRQYSVTTPDVGSLTIYAGSNYNTSYTTTYGASNADMSPYGGVYGPQSWRVGSTTTATFFTGKSYVGNSKVYGPGSVESNTFAVNPSPFLSVRLTSTSTATASIQQVGTILGTTYTFWSFADIQNNMRNLIYGKQNTDPANYTGAVATKLLALVNAMDCTSFSTSVTPGVPNVCAAIIAAAALAAQVAAETAAQAAKDALAAAAAQAAAQAAQNAATAAAAAKAAIVAAESKAIADAQAAKASTTAAAANTPSSAAASTAVSTSDTITILGLTLSQKMFWGIIAAVILAVLSSSSGVILWIRKRRSLRK